jgi:signal transduction histidine kinase
LRKFVEDFLAFSALQTGKIKMDLQLGDMNACLAEICSFWAPRFVEKHIHFLCTPYKNLPPLKYDSLKIQHVVSNLLQNALKYSPRERPVGLDVSAADGRVLFAVSDRGPGIAAEDQERIFELFYRTPEGARAAEGSGLGLAITRRLVRAMSGRIEVSSTPQEGSTFVVTIPTRASEGPAPPSGAAISG